MFACVWICAENESTKCTTKEEKEIAKRENKFISVALLFCFAFKEENVATQEKDGDTQRKKEERERNRRRG